MIQDEITTEELIVKDYTYEELMELYRNHYAILPTELREELRTNEIYEESVKSRALNLQHVPEKFRTKEMCEIAVSKSGFVLQYVPIELRTEELCNLAVRNWSKAEQFAPKGTTIGNNYLMKKALL